MNNMKTLLEDMRSIDSGMLRDDILSVMREEAMNGDYDGFWHMYHNEGGEQRVLGLYGQTAIDEIYKITRLFTDEGAAIKTISYLDYLSNSDTVSEDRVLRDDNDTDEMEMIKEEIRELVEQLISMVSASEEAGARSYWYPQILMALDSNHEWMGGSGRTIQETIDAMREETDVK